MDSLDDLEKVAANVVFMQKRTERLKRRMKARLLAMADEDPTILDLGNGDRGIMAGSDIAFLFIPEEKETIRDKGAMVEAMERRVEYGEDFSLADHVKVSEGVKFAKRKVPPR